MVKVLREGIDCDESIYDIYTTGKNNQYYILNIVRGVQNMSVLDVPYGVTCVSLWSTSGNTSVKELNIPDTVTGVQGFSHYDLLERVNLGRNVEYLGGRAFYQCIRLKDINLPYGLKDIDDNAFNGCASLRELKIPSTVESIGDYAFRKCTSLREITLSDGLTELGKKIFGGCSDDLIIHYKGCTFSPKDFNSEYALQDINDIASGNKPDDKIADENDWGF